jgi:hypothetical protein
MRTTSSTRPHWLRVASAWPSGCSSGAAAALRSDTTAPATASLGCDRLVGTRRPFGLKSRTIMISRLGLEYRLPALNMCGNANSPGGVP